MKKEPIKEYNCRDCGRAINEGEFKTFGVCDECWEKNCKKFITPVKETNQ